jgi:hypothetical protein
MLVLMLNKTFQLLDVFYYNDIHLDFNTIDTVEQLLITDLADLKKLSYIIIVRFYRQRRLFRFFTVVY